MAEWDVGDWEERGNALQQVGVDIGVRLHIECVRHAKFSQERGTLVSKQQGSGIRNAASMASGGAAAPLPIFRDLHHGSNMNYAYGLAVLALLACCCSLLSGRVAQKTAAYKISTAELPQFRPMPIAQSDSGDSCSSPPSPFRRGNSNRHLDM